MRWESLISMQNLKLAWRRITTGQNVQFKAFFRAQFVAYELGLAGNLKVLHEGLKGGWRPTVPSRAYMPKASGLQRPISLLCLEDQIVLQAVANLVAKKLWTRRKRVERRVAFANCLSTKKNSIFFFERWQESYRRFQERIERYYKSGLRWVTYFDLAAFYDTISHELFIGTVAPRSSDAPFWQRLREWLKQWSLSSGSVPVAHGLPQGPIASGFLAEVALLPLDEAMTKAGVTYTRYVDDIRILSKTENEARRAGIQLEIQCRELGLIPHSRKYDVRPASSLTEALGAMPSIRAQTAGAALLPEQEAYQLLSSATSGRPLRITDKTRTRYVLYRAPKSQRILRKTLRLLPHHPEQIDAFGAYFARFNRSRQIESVVTRLLQDGVPYAYVRGALWRILARIGSDETLRAFLDRAREDYRQARIDDALCQIWGAATFLLKCQDAGLCRFAGRLRRLKPLAQALLVPVLPDSEYSPSGVVPFLLKSPSFEAGIVLADQLIQRRTNHRELGVQTSNLAPQVQNVFKATGLISRRRGFSYDQIGRMLSERYGIVYWDKWRRILGSEYSHALQLLFVGDPAFKGNSSFWLLHQDSFNDVLFRRLMDSLKTLGIPGGMRTVGRNGQLVNYGSLLDPKKAFAAHYPNIASDLRQVHERRNNLPPAHPYDTRSQSKSRYLGRREVRELRACLQRAYGRVIALLNKAL